MRGFVSHLWNSNQSFLSNAGDLIFTVAINSVLGVIYWWLAAHLFPPPLVGLSSAAISAMTLLGTISVLGLGTLLIGELPRDPDQAPSLIAVALLVAGCTGLLTGGGFALLAPKVSPNLGILAERAVNSLLFALGVSLTAIMIVIDQALVGLLLSRLQLWRNALFAGIKLAILPAVGMWLTQQDGLTIFLTWIAGGFLSLAVLARPAIRRRGHVNLFQVPWQGLYRLGRTSLIHHTINLALQAPGLLLPVAVTTLCSASLNASFYITWMIASFVFIVPGALTTVLYAVGSEQPTMLAQKMRMTLKLSLLAGLLANAMIVIGADVILGLFGASYAAQASWCLRILTFGAFPLICKYHYVAACQVQRQLAQASRIVVAGALLEIILATVGISVGGLAGLSLGLVSALCMEAIVMIRTIYQSAFPPERLPACQASKSRLSV